MNRRRLVLYVLAIVSAVGITLVPAGGSAGPPSSPPDEQAPAKGGGNEKPKPCKNAKPKHCSSS